MAITLVTVLMGALASLTINVVTGTGELRARQGAAQLATSTMAAIAAVPPSDLITGRDSASVMDQLGAAPAVVSPWLASTTQVSDTAAAAGAGATAVISTAAVRQTLSNVTYVVNTYLGSCRMASAPSPGSPTSPSCTATSTGAPQLRAVVAVTWSGRGCRVGTCAYVTSTLVNAEPDPVFNTNRANPAPKPAVVPPGDQVTTRGTAVSLQLSAVAGTGVTPLTWQLTGGTLPSGLTLTASGLISGTPTAPAPTAPVTVTVSDVFGRTGDATFTWTVTGPPTLVTPVAQSTVQGQTVRLDVVSTCPNSPCTYAAAGLPAGLRIDTDTGTITGSPTTPTTSGPASVTVTVTDASRVAASTSPFTWTVLAPASIATPGRVRATIGTTVSVSVAYTCPAGPCTISLAGTAPGVGLSSTANVGSANATTTISVPTGSGSTYLAGRVQSSAVTSGTSQAYNPRLTITGASGPAATSGPADWIFFTPPTIGPISARSVSIGSTPDVALPYTCPNTPCTITLTNPVPGLGLSATPGRTGANTTTTLITSTASGTFYISGTVAANAVPSGTSTTYTMTATIADDSAVPASSSGTWTVTKAPKVTNPGAQAVQPNQPVSLQIAGDCPSGGCTWQAELLINGQWTSVSISSTGTMSYAGAPQGTYTARVTLTDSSGVSDTTSFPLTVQTFSLAIPDQTTRKPSSGTTVNTLDVAALMRPTAGDYLYTMSGAPNWLSIDGNGLLTASVTSSSRTDKDITVTVTSRAGSTSQVAATFKWTLT